MKVIFLIASNVLKEIFRKKDMYVLFFLLLLLMVYLANTAFFGGQDIYRYMKEIGLGMVFLFSLLISVPFTAKLMIEEIASKTIYPLLAKPIERVHILCGKFLGGILVSWSSFSIFYILFALISILKEGIVAPFLLLQVYVSGLIMLLALNSLVICLSVFCTFSTTVSLSYIVYFLMSWFGNQLRTSFENIPFFGQIIYYLLPHFEFFDLRHRLIHFWDPLPAWVMLWIIGYGIFYSVILLYCALYKFKKRWL